MIQPPRLVAAVLRISVRMLLAALLAGKNVNGDIIYIAHALRYLHTFTL